MNTRNRIYLSVAITLLGVALGNWGELMPDTIKSAAENFADSLGISFTYFWLAGTGLMVSLLLFLIWRERILLNRPAQEKKPTKRKVVQTGKGAVYVEKNKGKIDIH
jgi:hypothetical protein